MGSKIFASDMLISEMIMPMQNAYHHGDYEKASVDLDGLNMFLYGFGEGIENFPAPPQMKTLANSGTRERSVLYPQFLQECKQYYQTNYRVVMKRFGQYQKTMLDALERNKYRMMETTTPEPVIRAST